MSEPSRHLSAALLALALALPAGAGAVSSGMWHLARPEAGGCNCHGLGGILPAGVYPTAAPLLLLAGVPEHYLPGTRYELTVAVVGPVVPFAGFNLEVTGGVLGAAAPLLPEGGRAQVGMKTDECEALEADGHCRTCGPGEPGCVPSACEVRLAEECPVYGPDHPNCACAPAERGTSACRPCDPTTIVSMQATHTAAAVVPSWTLRWTAPSCGFGAVRFHLIGNSVDGDGSDGPGDLWNVWSAPQVSLPDPAACAP